nr:hypothetical protein CFP56_37068 [Quercus suber]
MHSIWNVSLHGDSKVACVISLINDKIRRRPSATCPIDKPMLQCIVSTDGLGECTSYLSLPLINDMSRRYPGFGLKHRFYGADVHRKVECAR